MSKRPRPLGRSRSSGSMGRWARGIKAAALVADHESRAIRIVGDQKPDAAIPIRIQGSPLSSQFVKSPVVLFAQAGADFEVAMEQRVPKCLVQGDGRAHQFRGIPAVKLTHLVLKKFEQRGNKVGVVA